MHSDLSLSSAPTHEEYGVTHGGSRRRAIPAERRTDFRVAFEPPGMRRGVLETIQRPGYHDWKRAWELPLALSIAVPVLLLVGLLMVLIRLTSRGPAVYSQIRLGKDGQQFTIYKLRSMYRDSEARGAQWCAGGNDPRITPLGWWLRKLHLDELPQIINLLRGEMSFCGPRPERPVFVEKLIEHIPYYETRMLVRPGITGLAQINLPPDSNLASVERKQVLDMEYIENGCFFSDMKMLLCTLTRIVGVSGSVAIWLLGLQFAPDESRFAFLYSRLHEPDARPEDLTASDAATADSTASGCVSLDEVFGTVGG